jgi:hypothetical protein
MFYCAIEKNESLAIIKEIKKCIDATGVCESWNMCNHPYFQVDEIIVGKQEMAGKGVDIQNYYSELKANKYKNINICSEVEIYSVDNNQIVANYWDKHIEDCDRISPCFTYDDTLSAWIIANPEYYERWGEGFAGSKVKRDDGVITVLYFY